MSRDTFTPTPEAAAIEARHDGAVEGRWLDMRDEYDPAEEGRR